MNIVEEINDIKNKANQQWKEAKRKAKDEF